MRTHSSLTRSRHLHAVPKFIKGTSKLFVKEKSDVRLVGAVTVCALHVPCPYCIDAPCMYPHVHVVMCHVCAMRVHMQADAQLVEFRFDKDLCFHNIPFQPVVSVTLTLTLTLEPGNRRLQPLAYP